MWAGLLSLLNDIYFGIVFLLCGNSKNPVPPKILFVFCVLDTVQDASVMPFEVPVKLNSQSAITVTSF